MAIVFLDTEFTNLLQPELSSRGLVALDPANTHLPTSWCCVPQTSQLIEWRWSACAGRSDA